MPLSSLEIMKHWMDPAFKFYVNRGEPNKEKEAHLLSDENLKGECLGACLDYIRWGAPTTVMYEKTTTELIEFIQEWMRLNSEELPWHNDPVPEGITLPHLVHEHCPRVKKHTGTFTDMGGKVRCSQRTPMYLEPEMYTTKTYFDEHSQRETTLFIDSGDPVDPEVSQHYGPNHITHNELIEDVCYAILDDRARVLPLSVVLARLNLEQGTQIRQYCVSQFEPCEKLDSLTGKEREQQEAYAFCLGHVRKNDRTVHPFDGWTLAWYVQIWYEQVSDGKSPLFDSKKKEK